MNKIEINIDSLYYIFFLVVGGGYVFWGNTNSLVYQIILVICTFLICMKVINCKYTKKELLYILFLGSLGLIVFVKVKRVMIVMSILAIIGIKNININKLLKYYLFVRIFIFSFVLLCNAFKWFDVTDFTMYHWRGGELVLRHSLGFAHPNTLQIEFLVTVLLFLYVYYEKLKIYHYVVILLLNHILYSYSYSRTSFYLCFFTILLVVFGKYNTKSLIKELFQKYTYLLCLLFTFVFPVLFMNTSLWQSVNSFTSGRVEDNAYYLCNVPLNLFGYRLTDTESEEIISMKQGNAMDSGYMKLLWNYGIILGGFFIVFIFLVLRKYRKYKLDQAILLIIILCIVGTLESIMHNVFRNVSLLFIGDYIFNQIPCILEKTSNTSVQLGEDNV